MIFISHLIADEEIQKLALKYEIGLESIEFSVAENLDDLGPKLCAYKKRIENMNVKALTCHGPFLDLNPMSYDRRIQEVTRLRFEQSYEAAKELGAEKIVFHSGFIPRINYAEGWAQRTADFFNGFMEKKSGITVCLENVYDPYPELMTEVKKLVESDGFALCLDTGHAHCNSDVPVLKWVQAFMPYMAHLHVHDNNTKWDYHMALGEGTLPLPEILPVIKSAHPGISAVIENRSAEDVLKSLAVLKEYGF